MSKAEFSSAGTMSLTGVSEAGSAGGAAGGAACQLCGMYDR